MGVFHLMGLGLSPGVVTGAVSHLAARYGRWNGADRAFFGPSGEVDQRARGDRVGDVQGIVLFTSREVMDGACGHFRDNALYRQPGSVAEDAPVRDVLRRVLPGEWAALAPGRREVPLWWCEVSRTDVQAAYTRVVQVMEALRGPGRRGKEMWVNLTGGSNVINAALQLAAALTGDCARLYYLQAAPEMVTCLRPTREDGYWVEVPSLPLALNPLAEPVLELLSREGSLRGGEIYGRLAGNFAELVGALGVEGFGTAYLTPLWKAGLIAAEPRRTGELPGTGDRVFTVGPRWEAILPYVWRIREAREAGRTLEDLAREDWLEQDTLTLR